MSLILIASVMAFSSCGGGADTNGSKVEINILPNQPKVFKEGFTIESGDDDLQIEGPWFLMQFLGTNTSEKRLIIVSITAKLTSTVNGQEFEWTPNLPEGAAFMGAAAPNAPIFWLVNANLSGGIEAVSAYVDGLPENQSLNYSIKLTFSGWFTEVDDVQDTPQNETLIPIESFEKTIILRARKG